MSGMIVLMGIAMRGSVVMLLMIVACGMVSGGLPCAVAVVRSGAKQHGRARITPDRQGHGEKQKNDQLKAAKHDGDVSTAT